MEKTAIDAIAQKMIEAVRGAVAQAESRMEQRFAELLEARLKELPVAERGEKGDPGAPGEAIKGDRGDKGDPGAAGKDGQSVDPIALQALVREAVDALPKAKDGKDGEPGAKGERGEAGAPVHPDTVALMVREAAEKVAAALPKPKDGADGFALEDFDVALSEDGRTLTFKFQRGDVVKERQIKLQTTNYLGVWREGAHDRGDVVTWGGSSWHCNRPTEEKPAYGCADWTLMVKEGRPGKDGAPPVPQVKELVRLK